jgi:uncharacterized radical SAM protein YgiQ
LPTSVKELQALGWENVDIILFTGDAYVDHPSFGTAVIGRVLEAAGYRVAIVPQPNWQDDLRDFRKLGKPRLFFGVSSGSMDSMVNHYTAGKRLRSDDAYTPEGRAGARPDRAATIYTRILKKLYPDVPVVLGGIEASLRRLSHYDYWEDAWKPSILVESGADFLVYGMGERPNLALAKALREGASLENLRRLPQIAWYADSETCIHGYDTDNSLTLKSYEDCLASKKACISNFNIIEREANKVEAARLVEPTGKGFVVVNPPYPLMASADLDAVYDLPFTRLPHPRYKGKRIPAYDMIKHSVCLHRGCFGGCSFCTIAAHQGKQIVSRSQGSVLRELQRHTQHPDFKGVFSDLGGPSANMYGMGGKNKELCDKCLRKSCLSPALCKNLDHNHEPLRALYQAVRALPGVKRAYVGSGIRYDLFLDEKGFLNASGRKYFEDLLRYHVSGRLKVAPEHTEAQVLRYMEKPSFALFDTLKQVFDRQNQAEGLRLQLIPYFISAHPGCQEADMQALARKLRAHRMSVEQVQDFTPTPMTRSSVMFYTGCELQTQKPLFVARSRALKMRQKEYFF